MKKIKRSHTWGSFILIPLCLLFILPICALSQQQSNNTAIRKTSDSAQITAIIHNWETSWNSHDMHAFANLFHEDAIWILWTGDVWKGKTAIENGHANVHKTYFRNSIQKEELEELTFVGSDVAVVRFNSTLTGDERYPDKIIRSRKLLVITKRNNVWKVGWGQNTRFAEATIK
jgi:uncharacterized protein (TIGR02246 family)